MADWVASRPAQQRNPTVSSMGPIAIPALFGVAGSGAVVAGYYYQHRDALSQSLNWIADWAGSIVFSDEAAEPDRPEGIPEDFVYEKPSKSGGGSVWVNPKNPKGDRIRVMPNATKGPYANQGAYAKVNKGGPLVDANGNEVRGPRPSASPESHIPLDKIKDIFK